MSYHNWLKILSKKNDAIHIDKVPQESLGSEEMACGAPSVAAEKLARILEQQKATAKILVVGDGAFSAQLSDYAIRMGQRLDCEVVALSIFDKSSQQNNAQKADEAEHFKKRATLGASRFADKTISSGVKFSQLSRTGTKEIVIDQAVREIAGIRYVLTEPDALVDEELSEHVQLPVIETTGSNI